MLTAQDARNLMPELKEETARKIKEVEVKIMVAAKKNGRIIKYNGGIGYNDEIAKLLTDRGFEVVHYTSPWDELEIRW